MKNFIFFFLIVVNNMAFPVSHEVLQQKISKIENPFDYDLGLKIIPSKHETSQVMICCHGYGQSNVIGETINSYKVVTNHIVSFNFPDFGITAQSNHNNSFFGSINEVLPLLYVLKRCIHDLNLEAINVYGLSAGGGAVINMLAILNQSKFDEKLAEIGISLEDKKNMIKALQAGLIILDCPLKSVEEIIEFRGNTFELEILASRYAKNNFRPIDSLEFLKGLKLNIVLNFQEPDEVLSNCDDELFIERLKKANEGITEVVIGNDGGHTAFHTSLWSKYKTIQLN